VLCCAHVKIVWGQDMSELLGPIGARIGVLEVCCPDLTGAENSLLIQGSVQFGCMKPYHYCVGLYERCDLFVLNTHSLMHGCASPTKRLKSRANALHIINTTTWKCEKMNECISVQGVNVRAEWNG